MRTRSRRVGLLIWCSTATHSTASQQARRYGRRKQSAMAMSAAAPAAKMLCVTGMMKTAGSDDSRKHQHKWLTVKGF